MKDNPKNPRKITVAQLVGLRESMREFGDLSGIVWNRQTGKLVGGHQRIKAVQDAQGEEQIRVLRTYETPTPAGTVLEGRVTVGAEEFTYRVVDWPPAKEAAAMIAANKHGGSWDEPALARLLGELKADGQELDQVGITSEQEARLAALLKALDERDQSQAKQAPSQVKMVQCYLSVEEHINLMKRVAILRKFYGVKDITQTVLRALELEAAL